MKHGAIKAGAAALLLAGSAANAASPTLMHWPDLLNRPHPVATKRLPYGTEPRQFADLWLPGGAGPYPTVLMVHGGCWQASVATLTIMDYVSEDLRKRGIAVWNIEYRGVDQPGGGYPGTFQDVGRAADALRLAARVYPLKIDRVVATGHSAGGHLALWLAARARLPASSALYRRDPLPIAAVVSLGGLPDLAAARARGDASCGTDAIDRLTGAPTPARPDVYQETSVPTLLPLGVEQVLMHGAEDTIAPPILGANYVKAAAAHHDPARLIVIPDSGHVELISPGTAAWETEAAEMERLLRMPSVDHH